MGWKDAMTDMANGIANTMGESADYEGGGGTLPPLNPRPRVTFGAPFESVDERDGSYFTGNTAVIPVADLTSIVDPQPGDKITQDPDTAPVVWTVSDPIDKVGESWELGISRLKRPRIQD